MTGILCKASTKTKKSEQVYYIMEDKVMGTIKGA